MTRGISPEGVGCADATGLTARLRILLLLPFPPRLDATHGGGRAMAELLRGVAGRHRVTVLYLRGPDEAPMDEALRSLCEHVEGFVVPGRRRTLGDRVYRRLRLVHGWVRGRPKWPSECAAPQFEARVREMVKQWDPEIVQFDYHVMGQYLAAVTSRTARKILVQYEPGAAAAWDRYRAARGVGRFFWYADARCWDRFEPAVLRGVDAVVVFTDRDEQALANFSTRADVRRIPLGVAVPPEPLDAAGGDPPSLLFVGNFTHPPNADAAVRLATGIFPAVREHVPSASLYIVGDQPTDEVLALASVPGVVVTGRVPEVEPYLDRAAVVVVPLRLGGGMRIKVMEALVAGKAAVASPLALAGLNVTDGEQVAVAESDEEFVSASVALLVDRQRRRDLGRRAHEWARDHLSWDHSLDAYDELYRSLLMGDHTSATET